MLDTYSDSPSPALSVKWRWEPRLNKEKTKAEGRPIYEDAEWVTIRIPGDQTMAIDHFATDDEKRQHRVSLERWKAKDGSEGIVGTRLEQWPPISRSNVEELKHFGIRTVEQLAAISDANVRNIPRGVALRTQAQAWIKSAKDSAPVAKVEAENQELKAQLAAMQKQMNEAMAQLERLTDPKAKKG